jgi:hypothetical protein
MTSTIGVYNDQETAVSAINALKQAGYSPNQLSILGHAPEDLTEEEKLEDMDSDHEIDKPMKIAATGVGIGALVGPVLGVLTGLGLMAIPGVGFLYGAGALAGAVAGLDAGLIGGGIFSALAIARTSASHEERYSKHLKEGRYIVVAQGSPEEVKHAHEVLNELDTHHELETHL